MGNSNQEAPESVATNKENSQPTMDPFTRLMFGGHHQRIRNDENAIPNEQPPNSGQIDYNELMKQVDDIMTSMNNIKPIFKQLSPLLDFLKKKK